MAAIITFQKQGTISLDPSAVNRVRTFLESCQNAARGKNLLPVFVWFQDRRFRVRGSNVWQSTGEGIDLCMLDRSQVPIDRIWRVDGMELALKLPSSIVETYSNPVLRLNSTQPAHFDLVEKSA